MFGFIKDNKWGFLLACIVASQATVSFILRDSYNFLDEAGYLENGRLLLEGYLPYIDYRDPHMPGIMLVVALFFKLFGVSLFTARFLMFLVNCLTALSAYFIFKWLGGKGMAVATALFWVVLSLSGSYRAFLLLIEPFQALIALWSFYFAVRYRESVNAKHLVASGVLFGLSLLFKQNYIFLAPLMPFYVAALTRELNLPRGKAVKDVLLFFVAGGAPGLTLIFALYAVGGGYRFLYDTIFFHLFGPGWMQARGVDFVLHSPQHFIPYIAFPLFLIFERSLSVSMRILLWAFIIAGAIEAFPRFEFFHLVPMLPFFAYIIARLIALASDKVSTVIAPKNKSMPGYMKAVLVAAVATSLAIIGYYGDPEFHKGFEAQREIARYVRDNSPPGSPIFVFPAMPTISFYSGMPLATGNIDIEPYTALDEDRRKVISELEQSKPEYVVYLEGTLIDNRPVEEWGADIVKYIKEHYTVEKALDDVFPYYCKRALIMRRKKNP